MGWPRAFWVHISAPQIKGNSHTTNLRIAIRVSPRVVPVSISRCPVMYDKKCYEMSCGDFRRDYPHFGNGFNSQYCANYGNLEQSGHSEDAAMNSIAWYAPSNCPVGNLSPQSVSCGHHGASHSSHLGSSVTGHPCRHSSSFPQHGHCSYPHAPDHDSLSVVQSGLVSGGNVNELSATSTEHVINRCDLYANR